MPGAPRRCRAERDPATVESGDWVAGNVHCVAAWRKTSKVRQTFLSRADLRRHLCRQRQALVSSVPRPMFGAGPSRARVRFVGEQPGDQEDRQGQPFVGPAGALLDKARESVGIPRSDVYVTNAVKRFKWEARGKRRIHKKPRMTEVKACRPWLEAELRAVKPVVVVCLGATAAQAVLGPQFKLMQHRGQLHASPLSEQVVATIHPFAILRAPDSEGRRQAFSMLVDDLKVVVRVLNEA